MTQTRIDFLLEQRKSLITEIDEEYDYVSNMNINFGCDCGCGGDFELSYIDDLETSLESVERELHDLGWRLDE